MCMSFGTKELIVFMHYVGLYCCIMDKRCCTHEISLRTLLFLCALGIMHGMHMYGEYGESPVLTR